MLLSKYIERSDYFRTFTGKTIVFFVDNEKRFTTTNINAANDYEKHLFANGYKRLPRNDCPVFNSRNEIIMYYTEKCSDQKTAGQSRETLLNVLESYKRMIERDNGNYPAVVLNDIYSSIKAVLECNGREV